MKINNIVFDKPAIETLVMPVGSQDIVFKAKCVTDYSDFDAMCPTPEPPVIKFAKGGTRKDFDDPEYKKAFEEWGQKRAAWMFIESISETEGLEWDTVDKKDPETWKNYEKDLLKVFSIYHIGRLTQLVFEVCGLSENRIQEATERFLATQTKKLSA